MGHPIFQHEQKEKKYEPLIYPCVHHRSPYVGPRKLYDRIHLYRDFKFGFIPFRNPSFGEAKSLILDLN